MSIFRAEFGSLFANLSDTLYQALMGGGSGLFASPNTSAIMSSVVPENRGIAAGVNYMLMNTGQMLSIAIVFPLALARIPEEVMFHVFLYGGGMSGAPLTAFESGMHEAFLASFAVTVVVAIISAMRPAHGSAREAVRVSSLGRA